MTRRRPRILCDVDGPLTPGFFEECCRVLRELGIAGARPDAIDRWDILEAFRVPIDVGEAAYAALRAPGIARGFLPRPGAANLVRELQTFADVYAVTAPLGGPFWADDREAWLREHLAIPPERVVSVRDKRVVAGDALVDDKVSTLEAWSAAHPAGLAILWREPHNAREEWGGPSASTYEELLAYLRGLRA